MVAIPGSWKTCAPANPDGVAIGLQNAESLVSDPTPGVSGVFEVMAGTRVDAVGAVARENVRRTVGAWRRFVFRI